MKKLIDRFAVGLYVAQAGMVALMQGLLATACLLLPIYVALLIRTGV